MSETKMPAAEVEAVVESEESSSYEIAFHVLPTVAEGEVPAVFEAIKTAVTNTGAEVFDEEAAERFDLAYEIIQNIEGKNRKFTTAYFGWIRFKGLPSTIASVAEEVESNENVLRHLIIRLTRVEEETPYRFHEALEKEDKMVTNVEEAKPVAAPAATEEAAPVAEKAEESAETAPEAEAEKA